MKDPLNTEPEPSKPPAPSPEEHWNDVAGYQNINFLGDTTFDSFVKEHNSVLVMFYAPCKCVLELLSINLEMIWEIETKRTKPKENKNKIYFILILQPPHTQKKKNTRGKFGWLIFN